MSRKTMKDELKKPNLNDVEKISNMFFLKTKKKKQKAKIKLN